jgi:hypothetical protein
MPNENKKSRWDWIGKFSNFSEEPRLKEMLTFQDRCIDCKWCRVPPSENSKEMVCVLYGERGFPANRPVPDKCIGKVERKY